MPPTPAPTGSRLRASRALLLAVVALLALALLLGLLRACTVSFGFRNPFGTETIDRSSPAVLHAIRDLRRLQTASGHFQAIVDVERDHRFVPAAIRGERVLFVAVGDVDAGVDLAGVGAEAVQVSDDRRSVQITLPPAEFFGVRIDPARSYVYDRERGLIDRVASLFQDSPTGERELYLLAEEKLLEAARGGSGILRRAERNTRDVLESMLRALGFEHVAIEFRDP